MVPVSFVALPFLSSPLGTPRSKPWVQTIAVAADLDRQPLRKGVDHRKADAVQAAGDLVALAAELAAGVQHGQHDLRRRLLVFGVHGHGDAAAVVDDGDGIVGVDDDVDLGAETAGQRLVDRVVDHLVDQMMQTPRAGGADVHARPFADRLKALRVR